MAVIRVPKGNFTTVENSIFKDGRLSLKAKGLFCYMLSKKDGWSFSSERISMDNNDGRDGVRAGLKELESHGYLARVKVNGGGGLFTTEYHLSYPTLPTDDALTDDGKSVVGLSDAGKTNVGKTDVGKPVDNSKEEYSKDYSSKTINSKDGNSNLFGADAQKKFSDDVFDFEKVWYSFRGKRNSFEKDFKNFLKKSEGVEVDFENLYHLALKVDNIYFQTWLNDVLPKPKAFGKPEFRQTLIDVGVDPQHVDDWIKVRTAKRASFTATALQLLFDECTKHNFPVSEAVKMCAGRSWQGFKYQWYLNEVNNGKQTPITAGQDRQERISSVQRMGDLARKIVEDAINNGSASH